MLYLNFMIIKTRILLWATFTFKINTLNTELFTKYYWLKRRGTIYLSPRTNIINIEHSFFPEVSLSWKNESTGFFGDGICGTIWYWKIKPSPVLSHSNLNLQTNMYIILINSKRKHRIIQYPVRLSMACNKKLVMFRLWIWSHCSTGSWSTFWNYGKFNFQGTPKSNYGFQFKVPSQLHC